MEKFNDFILTFAASDWVYAVIFILAIAEAFALSTFFLSGTIGFVVIGILIAQELLEPFWAFLMVYTGSLVGDICSFYLSQWLQRFSFINTALERLAAVRKPLSENPIRFILIGNFVPYLRPVLPVLAGGIVPGPKYIVVAIVAAFFGTTFFIGLGYVGSEAISRYPPGVVIGIVGVIAGILVVVMWIKKYKPFCPLKHKSKMRWTNIKRGLFFYIWFLPWYPVRGLESWLRDKPTRILRRSITAAFEDVQPGDVFLIRLHSPAPWGRWAHSAIAVSSKRFVHGFAKKVTAHSIGALPVRYAIAHLRPVCSSDISNAAAQIAASKIDCQVSIAANRYDRRKFSCSSLVAHAYREAGLELVDPSIARIVPNDLFTSSQMKLVRIVNTEKVSKRTSRYIFEARKRGEA